MTCKPPPLEVRILENIELDDNGCWLWTKAKNPDGYGKISVGNKSRSAHRVVYETLRGEIPAGFQIDHLCRVRHCVNPDHLEPVTPRENTLRGDTPAAHNAAKTFCPHGHPYSEENTYRGTDGLRRCITCRTGWVKAYRARKKVEGDK